MNAREQVEGLLLSLSLAYDQASWHGSNLKGSIRGVNLRLASWRPDPARHNIWEIVVHAAYWKYAARRRLTGEKRSSFPLEGNNWFERPLEQSLKAWRSDRALLDAQHSQLVKAVGLMSDQDLLSSVEKGLSAQKLIQGVAFHDVYHSGQIRLLRRLSGLE